VPLRVFAGATVGFLGVAVLSQPAWHVSADLACALLCGALSYAFAILRLRKLGVHEDSEAIALHMSLVAGVTLLIVSLPHFVIPARHALLPLAASALAGGCGQIALSRAYGLGRAARLSAVSYSGVVITYGLEALWFARLPMPNQWIGSILVCTAGVIVSSRSATAADADVPQARTAP
jgi:drug/metabolite transporter (DMT)-like permease